MKSTAPVNPEKLLLEFFNSENIPLEAGGCVFAVCFSGGEDSTALLSLMHRLSLRYRFLLKAVHIRHNIRNAEESRADEEFVRRFCGEREIELRCESLPPGLLRRMIRECGRSPEEAARAERYRIFSELKEEGFADWFLTAHHADDNRETVVQRVFEGAGLLPVLALHPDLAARHGGEGGAVVELRLVYDALEPPRGPLKVPE